MINRKDLVDSVCTEALERAVEKYPGIKAQLESQPPRWSLMSEGWPTVEGDYFALTGDSRDPYKILDWSGDHVDREEWSDEGIERFIHMQDLKKLPGGPGEESNAR